MPRKERGAFQLSLPRMLLNRLWKDSPSNDDTEDEKYLEFVRAAWPDLDLINQSVSHLLALPLTAVFQPLQLSPLNDPSSKQPLTQYLAQERPSALPEHLLILGAPGSGKTTLLRHLTHALAHGKAKRETNYLPVLLTLRDIEHPIRTSPIWSLADAIMGQVAKRDFQIKAKWIRAGLKAGKFLILLDGLDEIHDSQMRALVQRWIEQQMQIEPQTQFIISSRPFAHRRDPLISITPLQIRPLTTDQIEHYIRDWFRSAQYHRVNGHTPRQPAPPWQKQAEQAIQMLHRHEPLIKMAHNPLLLRMLLNVYTNSGSFATQRVRFFEQLCTIWLGGWRQAKGLIEDLTAVQKQRVLQLLAHHMTTQQLQKISLGKASRVVAPALQKIDQQQGAQFLRTVANRSGLLVAEPSGHYRFAHSIVQDYLTAVFIQETKQEFQLSEHIDHEWWHQTILFYVAITKNPIPIVHACLQKEPPSVAALTLAATCLQELPNHPETQRLSERLHGSGGNQNLDVRLTYAQVIKTLHLREMVRLNEKTAVGYQLVPNAMYQLFIEAQRRNGHFCQPDHWALPTYPNGAGRDPLLGVRASDALAFCRWLNETKTADWFYRLPTPHEAKALLLQSGFRQQTSNHSSGFWVSTPHSLRFILDSNAQNHWLAEANFANKLTFDLSQLDAPTEQIAQLHNWLTKQAKQHAYSLSPQIWLFAELPVPSARAALQLAFERDAGGQLLNLDRSLYTLSHAINNGQRGEQINAIRRQLLQQGQRTAQAVRQIQGERQLQRELQLLTEQINKLLGQLPLRPSLIDQTLMRQLNQLVAQLNRVADARMAAVAKVRRKLRAQALTTLLQLHKKQVFPALAQEHQQIHSFSQELYIDLVILDGRTKPVEDQRQPALEGIRLIRERAMMKS